MTDMTSMISMIDEFHEEIDAFRNLTLVQRLLRFLADEDAMVRTTEATLSARLAEFNQQAAISAAHDGNSTAVMEVVAKALLTFEEQMRSFNTSIGQMAQTFQGALPASLELTNLVNARPLTMAMDEIFGRHQASLQDFASGLTKGTTQEFCRLTSRIMPAVRLDSKLTDRFERHQSFWSNNTDKITNSPVVLIAPDVIPKMEIFAKAINSTALRMTHVYQASLHNITSFVEAQLGGAGCAKSAAAARPPVLSCLLLALAVTFGDGRLGPSLSCM